MFSSKNKFDVKKSTQKFLDLKKDIQTRYKHLRSVLENLDGGDLKYFFEHYASHILFIFTENFAVLEFNIKQKGARGVREEFESAFHLLENILVYLPETLHKRWHHHTLYRIFLRLLHPQNNVNLRREAIRLFVVWYQILGDESTDQVHALFSTLIPGFPSPFPGLGLCNMAMLKGPTLGPICDSDILPLAPAAPGDKLPDDLPRFFLEGLLRSMVNQLTRIHWRDKTNQMKKAFNFLFESFKKFYIDPLFPEFRHSSSIYKPCFEMPQARRLGPKDPLQSCRVEVIKWVSNFIHVPIRDSTAGAFSSSGGPPELTRSGNHTVSLTGSDNESTESSAQSRTSLWADQGTEEIRIVQEILFGSRVNVNFIHEVFRQAFLLTFSHSLAICRVIGVYKDWITKKVDVPPFALEPVDLTYLSKYDENNRSDSRLSMSSDASRSIEVTDGEVTRLRHHSSAMYLQQNKEYFMVRAGLQNVLQTFITNSSNVFLLDLGRECARGLLEEQIDICKRVLNIYRHMVTSVKMDQRTWEQLLAVLLHITSQVLSRGKAGPKEHEALQDRLAEPLCQTLVVTWIRANLNVSVSGYLWDQFVKVLSSLTEWEELIREWAQTMERMTRILARNLYSLDLDDLPLDRLTELKAKKRRGGLGEPFRTPRGSPKKEPEPSDNVSRCSTAARAAGSSAEKVAQQPAVRRRRLKKCQLRRTCSDGCIQSKRREEMEKGRGMTDPLIETSDDEEYVFGPRYRPRNYTFTEQRSLNRWYSCESYLQNKKANETGNDSDDESRCSSPAPSSGVESTSIRDTPMPIDGLHMNLDSHSMDTIDSVVNENRSVMLGGVRRGWQPDSAALLWKRVLCSLGDVNEIANPETHAKVFEQFLVLAGTLVKIRANQGVSLDNLSTPPLPEFIPPVHIFIPWCFKAFELPDSHSTGKLYALRLLCSICVRQWDIPVKQEYLNAFYKCLHKGLTSNNQETIEVIFRSCIPRFFSLQLPGYSLLIGDFLYAANFVISSSEIIKMPRKESISLLGSLLFFPELCENLSTLEPNPNELKIIRCQDFRESLLSLLLRAGKREPTPLGRCISVCSLAIFIYKELEAKQFHPKMKEAVLILLNALRQCSSAVNPGRSAANRASEFRVKTVAQIACDMLYLISDHADVLVKLAPELACRIIEEVAGTLVRLIIQNDDSIADDDKRLFLSLELCLAEWCMRLPLQLLLQSWPGPHSTSLLDTVLKVLKVAQSSSKPTSVPAASDLLEDFDNDAKAEEPTGSNSSTLTPTHSRLTTSLTRGGRKNRNHENITTVRMGAQFVMDHLLNQLGHFPLGSDAARHTSMVSEIDDLPNTDQPSSVFDSPNVQIFVLNRTKLISFVELPILLGPGGGVPAGLQTDKTEVRVIIRDLNGKHCWDTAVLYNDAEVMETRRTSSDPSIDGDGPGLHVTRQSEDLNSVMSSTMINGKLLALPHHTVRHRPAGELPSWENTEPDMDNLHDILSYVKYTSPEVCGDAELTCPKPPPSCFTTDMEDEAITFLLSQKTTELEFVSKFKTDITMTSQPCEEPEIVNTHMPFHMCRMLVSQLGLLSWENRNNIHLLKKNEQLIRELKNLDNQKCRETHKIAVIYVAQGQEDKVSILSNNAGSPEFEDFVARLGWEVELENHKGFMGGLQRNGSTGETAPYYATSLLEIIYHVSTRMPSDSQECLLQKTRHLGNDEVHIVWSEHTREYRRGIIPTEFCDVLIIIYPLANGLYRIQVSKKPEIPFIGPLFNESIVDKSCLPGLVRATALNASRAKRSLLPLYQTFFEERYYALESLVDQFALPSSFEEFCSQILVPASSGHFQPAPSRMSSGSLLSTQQQFAEPVSLTSLHSNMEYPPRPSSHMDEHRKVSDVSAPDIDESPKPSKRLSFKQASRFVAGLGLLPDVSPVIDQKRFPK